MNDDMINKVVEESQKVEYPSEMPIPEKPEGDGCFGLLILVILIGFIL